MIPNYYSTRQGISLRLNTFNFVCSVLPYVWVSYKTMVQQSLSSENSVHAYFGQSLFIHLNIKKNDTEYLFAKDN